MSFEEVYQIVKSKELKGWMGEQDCRALYGYASKIDNGLIVEIGSFMGISSSTLALSSPTSEIISIDPYLKVHPSCGLPDTPKVVRDRCKQLMEPYKWSLIEDLSQNVGKTWNKPIDLLMVDGNHNYKPLMEDLRLFVPHVKNGGVIMLHDYTVADWEKEENGAKVKKAAWDYFGKDKVLTVEGFGVIQK